MARARLFVENLFSTIQFPDHTVTANEEAAGFEVEKLANGRRSSLDYWTPTTANQAATVTITCDRVRAANQFALDRGHNLAGKTITLAASNDNFTTSETVFSIALPSASTQGPLNNGLGIVTEEDAWVISFDVRAAKYWRLTVAAMGAGLKPQIVGAWLGSAFDGALFREPWDDGPEEAVGAVVEGVLGALGIGTTTPRRRGSFTIRMEHETQHLAFRYHQHLFNARWPTWLTFDDGQAERSFLVQRDGGPLSIPFTSDVPNRREGAVGYVEHSPRAL